MTSWHNEKTDMLCDALLKLETKDEVYAFLDDVCTIKETLDLAQRLNVAVLLSERTGYTEITARTGASAATISRVSKCYEYGSGGYKMIIERLNSEEK